MAVSFFCACTSSRDSITYFQDIESIPAEAWDQTFDAAPRLQPDDELTILVTAVDQATVAAFNKTVYSPLQAGDRSMTTQPNIQTYLVDTRGDIIFPVLGKLHVQGLTTLELRDLLQERIHAYAADAMVSVTMASFAIPVMGEVLSPGVSHFSGNRATVLEAISTRGDLTIYGDRRNVLLIRETNGHKEYHRIDLTSADFINSPYYYLKQDDVIYVSPNNARRGSSRYNSMKQQNLSMISTVVSVVSVLSSLIIAIWK